MSASDIAGAISAVREAIRFFPLRSWIRELIDADTGFLDRFNGNTAPIGVTIASSRVRLTDRTRAPRIATVFLYGDWFIVLSQRIFPVNKESVWIYFIEGVNEKTGQKALFITGVEDTSEGLLIQGVRLEWYLPIGSAVSISENYFS